MLTGVFSRSSKIRQKLFGEDGVHIPGRIFSHFFREINVCVDDGVDRIPTKGCYCFNIHAICKKIISIGMPEIVYSCIG